MSSSTDDDELDDMLERSHSSLSPRTASANLNADRCLSFAFPGWGVDMIRDPNQQQSSFVRHTEEDRIQGSIKMKAWQGDLPIHGSPIAKMPEEILLNVFRRLCVKELCSSSLTCKQWYFLCHSGCLWENFVSSCAGEGNLPKWLIFKQSTVMSRVAGCFTYLSKGYEHLVRALDVWWANRQPDERYRSSSLTPLIRKLTQYDWSLTYEGFSVTFTSRADFIASSLRNELQNHTRKKKLEGIIGTKIWCSLFTFWGRYKAWIKLVAVHCTELNHEIMVERVRAVETPTLYDKGIICFRSQVMLSFGLRSILQAGLSWLSLKESQGSATEQEMELLCALHHLLQEVDVADDFTMLANGYTQAKLRRCFLNGESSKEYSRLQIVASRRTSIAF